MRKVHCCLFVCAESLPAVLNHFRSEIEMTEKVALRGIFSRAELACGHFAELADVMKNYSRFYHFPVGIFVSPASRLGRYEHSVHMIKQSAANIMMHFLRRRPYQQFFPVL